MPKAHRLFFSFLFWLKVSVTILKLSTGVSIHKVISKQCYITVIHIQHLAVIFILLHP